MAFALLGSSNVQRFYDHTLFPDNQQYKLSKCVNIETFLARMACLNDGDCLVVMSILENFVIDSVKSGFPDGEIKEEMLMDNVGSTIDKVLESIQTAATKLQKTRFVLVHPMQRPAVQWYMHKLPDIVEMLKQKADGLNLNNVALLDCFATESQHFDQGGVHLTPGSGSIFVGAMLSASEAYYQNSVTTSGQPFDWNDIVAADTDMDENDLQDSDAHAAGTGKNLDERVKDLEKHKLSLEQELTKLTRKFNLRTKSDTVGI